MSLRCLVSQAPASDRWLAHMRRLAATLGEQVAAVIAALPLRKGMRVLEIGCGPGAAVRGIAERVAPDYVLRVERSR